MGAGSGVADNDAAEPVTSAKAPRPWIDHATSGLANANETEGRKLIKFNRNVLREVISACSRCAASDQKIAINPAHDHGQADDLSEAQALAHADKEVAVRWSDVLKDHRRVKTSDVLDAGFFVAIGDLKEHSFE